MMKNFSHLFPNVVESLDVRQSTQQTLPDDGDKDDPEIWQEAVVHLEDE
jgi:hypothetical protein